MKYTPKKKSKNSTSRSIVMTVFPCAFFEGKLKAKGGKDHIIHKNSV